MMSLRTSGIRAMPAWPGFRSICPRVPGLAFCHYIVATDKPSKRQDLTLSCARKEIGWFPVQAMPAPLSGAFRGFRNAFTPLHWHGDTFDLPPGAIHLARGPETVNQAFQVGRRVLGLQFHLEATPASVDALVEHCAGEIGGGSWEMDAERIRDCEQRCAAVRPVLDEVLAYSRRTPRSSGDERGARPRVPCRARAAADRKRLRPRRALACGHHPTARDQDRARRTARSRSRSRRDPVRRKPRAGAARQGGGAAAGRPAGSRGCGVAPHRPSADEQDQARAAAGLVHPVRRSCAADRPARAAARARRPSPRRLLAGQHLGRGQQVRGVAGCGAGAGAADPAGAAPAPAGTHDARAPGRRRQRPLAPA